MKAKVGRNLADVSVAQLSVDSGDPQNNFNRAADQLKWAIANNKTPSSEHVVIFPECYLTGYITSSHEETVARALGMEHPVFSSLMDLGSELNIHMVVGFLERSDTAVFNSAVLITPQRASYLYRKQHLLCLGADRFALKGGAQSAVIDLPFARTGIMICYDLRFPETARRLALEGANLIAMPTNWPSTATILADHFARVRAAENGVYLAVANRPDSEAGIDFLGRSQIIDPNGNVLVDAGLEEGIFTAQLSLTDASEKQRVVSADTYEYNIFSDRRPELYAQLAQESLIDE